ncbi:MAG TPA: phosphatase PAP2 family protein [Chthoniobacteraceae bacterium]|nr:phosphatase PAP2 family protein [Chthoniobacteraceae bacterium]
MTPGIRSSRLRWFVSALAAVALIGCSFPLDAPVELWMNSHQNPAVIAVAKSISRFSAWPWLISAAAVCLAFAWVRQKRNAVSVLVAMIIASSLAGLSADVLRGSTGRTRPYATPAGIAEQGWYGVHSGSQWLVGQHAYNAFPSGHTATAAAFSVALFLSRRVLGAVLLGCTGVVAASRIYLGAHHFSDVIAGAVLGSAVALWVHGRLMPRLSRRSRPTRSLQG